MTCSEVHDHLAGVGTIQQIYEGLRGGVETLTDGLIPVDGTVGDPTAHVPLEVRSGLIRRTWRSRTRAA